MSKATDASSYAASYNFNLPWGHWLLYDGQDIVDEDGQRWRSVRECLWRSRLGMPKLLETKQDEALEFLLMVLAVIDRRIMGIEERVRDLFEGSWTVARHYAYWLMGHGLTNPHPAGVLEGPLTYEGRAVLLMLASTRSPEHAPIAIGLDWVRIRRGLDRGQSTEDAWVRG